MKKLLLSVSAFALAFAVNAQKAANYATDGKGVAFDFTKGTDAENLLVDQPTLQSNSDGSLRMAYANTTYTFGSPAVNNTDGTLSFTTNNALGWHGVVFNMIDPTDNTAYSPLDLSGSGDGKVEMEINASKAGTLIVYFGDESENFTDKTAYTKSLAVGNNTVSLTVSDWNKYPSGAVDATKIKYFKLSVRNAWSDQSACGADPDYTDAYRSDWTSIKAACDASAGTMLLPSVNGTFKIKGMKLGNQLNVVSTKVNVSSEVSMYPNPASDVINVNLGAMNGASTLKLISTTGNVVLEQTANGSEASINVSNLNSGVYMLQIVSNDKIATKSVVVE